MDELDSCLIVANIDQANLDCDVLGDACDPDADGDNALDLVDNCPRFANPSQADVDGEGPGDACDNCPFTFNPAQTDRGGILEPEPDGIGDVCQCGDVNGNGTVTLTDAVLIRRSLLQPPTATLPHSEMCDVGATAGCTLSDAVTAQRALLVPPTATVQQVCAPARP